MRKKRMFYPLLTMIAVFMVMLMVVGTSQATTRTVNVGDQAVTNNLLTLPVNVAGHPILINSSAAKTQPISDTNVQYPTGKANAMLETSGALIGNMTFATQHPFTNDDISIFGKSIETITVSTQAQMVTAKNDSYTELNKGAILGETAMKNGESICGVQGADSSGEMANMVIAKMDSNANKPNVATFGHYTAAGCPSLYG